MPYDHLVARVSYLTGHPESIVREVISGLPDALLSLPEGDKVRTPLGVFRMIRKLARLVNLPGGAGKVQLNERLQIRLDAGSRLRKVAT